MFYFSRTSAFRPSTAYIVPLEGKAAGRTAPYERSRRAPPRVAHPSAGRRGTSGA